MWNKIKALFGSVKTTTAHSDMSTTQDMKYCPSCDLAVPIDHEHQATPQQSASNKTDDVDNKTDDVEMKPESDM